MDRSIAVIVFCSVFALMTFVKEASADCGSDCAEGCRISANVCGLNPDVNAQNQCRNNLSRCMARCNQITSSPLGKECKKPPIYRGPPADSGRTEHYADVNNEQNNTADGDEAKLPSKTTPTEVSREQVDACYKLFPQNTQARLRCIDRHVPPHVPRDQIEACDKDFPVGSPAHRKCIDGTLARQIPREIVKKCDRLHRPGSEANRQCIETEIKSRKAGKSNTYDSETLPVFQDSQRCLKVANCAEVINENDFYPVYWLCMGDKAAAADTYCMRYLHIRGTLENPYPKYHSCHRANHAPVSVPGYCVE